MNSDSVILDALRSATVHMLPGDVAGQAGVSLREVEAGIARLREAGFEIESRPGLGVRLLDSPDRLIADDLRGRLGDCALAREILVFEETGSTNDVAVRLGREGHPGVVVFAERQTAGRGRFGRRWDSAGHSGLWFSVLLRPGWPPAHWTRLTTWAGVAVASAVERVVRVRARIKWPNDVHVDGRKIAGILIESAVDTSGGPFAVVGIGLNVNQTEFPPEIAGTAGSLRQIAGRALDRAEAAVEILRELQARLPEAEDDFRSLLAEAGRRSSVLSGWVRLACGRETVEGTAEALDKEGNLLLRLADGTLRPMTAGEVTSQIPDFVPSP